MTPTATPAPTPAPPSRYEAIRRRLAPVAMILGIGVLVWQMCKAPDRALVTLTVDLGSAASVVSEIDVVIREGNDVVGQIRRKQGGPHPMSPMITQLNLPLGLLSADFEVDAGGRRHQLTRKIEVREATPEISVALGDELARAP